QLPDAPSRTRRTSELARGGGDQRGGGGEGLGERAERGGEGGQQHVGAGAAGLADALGRARVSRDVEERTAEHRDVGLGEGLPDRGQGERRPVEEVNERLSEHLVSYHGLHGAD